MLIAVQISTGIAIQAFQSGATADWLMSKAAEFGIPEKDIEIRDVDKEEYWIQEGITYGPARAQMKAEEDAKNALLDQKAAAIKSKLKLSDDDVEGLRRLLL